MGRSFAEELPKHLETWVREGLISPESAEILLRRNQSAAGAAADAVKRKLLTVLAILCAALFSGGLILVIAHNWDMLSPFCYDSVNVMADGFIGVRNVNGKSVYEWRGFDGNLILRTAEMRIYAN